MRHSSSAVPAGGGAEERHEIKQRLGNREEDEGAGAADSRGKPFILYPEVFCGPPSYVGAIFSSGRLPGTDVPYSSSSSCSGNWQLGPAQGGGGRGGGVVW